MQKFSLTSLITAALLVIGFATAPVAATMDMASWKKAVAKKVAKKQKYPRSAIAKEIEGRAVVRLTVAADGTIASHEVVEATGADVLDREIPKLMKRLNPLPALPAGTEETSLRLPLDWRLK